MIRAWLKRRAERKAAEVAALEARYEAKHAAYCERLSRIATPQRGYGGPVGGSMGDASPRPANDDGGSSAFLFAAGIAASSYDPGCSSTSSFDSGSSCSSDSSGSW